jgi:hypothetical protein
MPAPLEISIKVQHHIRQHGNTIMQRRARPRSRCTRIRGVGYPTVRAGTRNTQRHQHCSPAILSLVNPVCTPRSIVEGIANCCKTTRLKPSSTTRSTKSTTPSLQIPTFLTKITLGGNYGTSWSKVRLGLQSPWYFALAISLLRKYGKTKVSRQRTRRSYTTRSPRESALL